MRTVRTISVTALSTVTTVAFIGLLGSQLSALPAAAVAPSWQTAASYTPLANVAAVSCAPSTTSPTCVAVGDDGGHLASIIVTQNGGSTWSDSSPPSGVTTLSTVSCPSTSVCYAGGGSGIMKSTNGGASWVIQDAEFPAESISCFNIDECTAVGGLKIVETTDGSTGTPKTPPSGLNLAVKCLVPVQLTCVAVGVVGSSASIVGTQNGDPWTTLDQPSVTSLTSISCANQQRAWQSGSPRAVEEPR